MAQAQVAARFVTEVAPPQVVSVMRRRKVPWCLDTIAEEDDDREHQLLAAACGSPSDHGFAAAVAWSLKRMPPPRESTGRFVMTTDLGRYFSDAHGCQASGWEEGHRRAGPVHAQELHKAGA